MQIVGPDRLVLAGAGNAEVAQFITDYGLARVPADGNERYEALDGTSIDLVSEDDAHHPDTLGTGNRLRRIVYGVVDTGSLDAVAEEMAKDREFERRADGSFDILDPLGFALTFQLTCRRPLDLAPEAMNVPGSAPQRGINQLGVKADFAPQLRSLSHFALFVPELEAMEDFYVNRLQFRINDRLGGGPFMRPAGTLEHHTMFLIKTPPFMKGIEHLTFHMGGAGEVLSAGTRFLDLGYPNLWGPGRHQMGGNWFWYFKSPLGCNFEYDADMDQHDDSWTPRELPFHPDNAQWVLFERRETFVPGAPPASGDH